MAAEFQERGVAVPVHGDIALAATLCLPTRGLPTRAGSTGDRPTARRAPAVLLIGGTGGDTRDGDPDPAGLMPPPDGRLDGAVAVRSGLLRALAHRLARHGVASLRYDKRGCGHSGGAVSPDYDVDTADAIAGVDTLAGQPEVAGRVAVAGHSAGAMIAGRVVAARPQLAGAALIGALYGPADDMIVRNWGRVARFWGQLSPARRAWLVAHRPADVVRGFGVEEFLAAVTRGDQTARIAAPRAELIEDARLMQDAALPLDAELTLRTARARHDIAYRDPFAELARVRVPALVLHGGEDLNVRVSDALDSYRALRAAGNRAVELAVLPGLDHHLRPVATDQITRVWERISLSGLHHPIDHWALDVVASWLRRTLVD